MAIYRTEAGIWVIWGDTHRTVWVEAAGSLFIDATIRPICQLIVPGSVVVDVGANIGDHTVFYRDAVGPSGRVIAFEPDPEAYACLLLNAGFSPDFHNAGLGSGVSTSGIVRHANPGQNYLAGDGDIAVLPLDALELEACHLIKIDVEGLELQVLDGAKDTINRLRPIIVIELIDEQLRRFGSSKESVVHWPKEHGYHDLVPLRIGESMQDSRVDAVCFHRESSQSRDFDRV